jgi:soluble lytic murein transglycosylase
VREWIERFGDPRDPKVDPVDWVERIPFMETRNYVQRVMENLQVYRALFGGNAPLTIESDRPTNSPAETDRRESGHALLCVFLGIPPICWNSVCR